MTQSTDSSIDGGQSVVDWMRNSGISAFFNVPGESFLPVLAAIEDSGITVITNRHESCSSFAAEAFGKVTGRPAVCMATRGPGASNLSIGVQTANYDGTPLVALIGQVPLPRLESRTFQGVDIPRFFAPISKSAESVASRRSLRPTLERAFDVATRPRTGPTVVAIPEDILSDTAIEDPASSFIPTPIESLDDVVQELLRTIRMSHRPAFLSALPAVRGNGASDLAEICERLSVPMFAAWRRWSSVDPTSTAFCGALGLGSSAVIAERFAESDLIIGFGDVDEDINISSLRMHQDRERCLIVVGKREDAFLLPPIPHRTELGFLNFDAKEVLAKLVAVCRNEARETLQAPQWERKLEHLRDEFLTLQLSQNKSADDALLTSRDAEGVNMDAWAATLDRTLPTDAIVVSDAGNFSQWILKYFRFGGERVYLGPVNGAMGYGLPGALGASIAKTERPVWAVCGDGGLGMTLGELETISRLNLNIAVVVVNNGAYGTIKSHQETRYGPGHSQSTDLGCIDFRKVADGFGWSATTVRCNDDLSQALSEMANSSGPRLLQVVPRQFPLAVGVN